MPTSWAIIFSEGFAPRQKHYNILFMESRNISLTTSEEGFISSSRDRKAVYDDTDNFIGLTGGNTFGQLSFIQPHPRNNNGRKPIVVIQACAVKPQPILYRSRKKELCLN